MRRRDISRALIASAAASAAPGVLAGAQARDGAQYPTIGAEAAAGLTIADSRYPPGCVDRYGINAAPGTTSMVPAFNAAIQQAQRGGAQVTYGATAPYLLDSPVNCTFAGRANQHGVVIRNLGDAGGGFPSLIAKHRGVAVFDCTGTEIVELYDVVIGTDPAVYPQTGVLWARNSNGGSLFHKMQNCRIFGSFSVAPFYNYGAESDALIDCYLVNYAKTPGTKVAVWTANNFAGLRSMVPGLIATGAHSCIDHNCFGNQYYNAGGTDTSDCVYLEQADSWKNFGGWAYSASSTANGGALIYVDMARAASNFALIEGLTGEVSTRLQAYGIRFSHDPFTPTGWKVESCRLPNAVYAIEAGAATTLDNFHIGGISEQASHGLSAAGTVQNSVLHTVGLALRIGRSLNNALVGKSQYWSIGARSKDVWIDQGGGGRDWNANVGALCIEGTLEKRAIYTVHGSAVTINVVLAASGSICCGKGAVITGLPFVAADYSTDVNVTNITAQAELLGGYIDGDKLCLPAIDVATDRIVITATYVAA